MSEQHALQECPNCKMTIRADANICPHCRTDFAAIRRRGKANRTFWYFVFIAGGLLVLCAAGAGVLMALT